MKDRAKNLLTEELLSDIVTSGSPTALRRASEHRRSKVFSLQGERIFGGPWETALRGGLESRWPASRCKMLSPQADFLLLRATTPPGPSPVTKIRARRSPHRTRKKRCIVVSIYSFLLCLMRSLTVLEVFPVACFQRRHCRWWWFRDRPFFWMVQSTLEDTAVFMPWAWELQQTKSCGAGVLLIKGTNAFVSDLERMTDSWKIREMQM